MAVEKQVAIIYATTNGFLDDVPVPQVRKWERDFIAFLDASHADLLSDIKTKKTLDDALSGRLKAAIESFKPRFVAA